MSKTDTSAEAVERLATRCIKEAVHLEGIAYPSGEAMHYRETEVALRTLAAERDAYKNRGDNHWETLRSIREIAQTSGDLERIILWVNDSGSGYTQTVEQTLVEVSDSRNTAIAERDALRAQLAEAEAAALELEQANDALCSARTQEIYDLMMKADQSDLLTRLDFARSRVRALKKGGYA
jgi:chaperonin cofactor prefoldin